MVKLTVLYEQPSDVEKFDAHYLGTHVALAHQVPDIERVEFVRYGPGPDGAAPAYHLIAGLYFKDAATMQAALATPEGQALAADVQNFPPVKSTAIFGETV
jgi:uncharacterized protein (TIGR02118 family)